MRVLVIGNSHAACLIEAWRSRGAEPARAAGLAMDFFARAGAALTEFACDAGRVFAPTPEGRAFQQRLGQKESFMLADYDSIVVIGHELSIFRLVQIVGRSHVLGWPYDNRPDLAVITRACLRDALADALDATNAARILRQLGPALAATGQRLLAVPQPFPSPAICEGRTKAMHFARICEAGIGPQCRELFNSVAETRMAALGALFLPQPPQTVVDGILTRTAFTTGAKRLVDLTKPQATGDVLHANAAYGALILNDIASAADLSSN